MEKKNTLLIILSIFIFLIIIFSATYAYFQAQRDTDASAEINITSDTTDSISFNTGDAISINPTMNSFSAGSGNQSDETTATAILRANSKTHEALANYYVYLKITNNEFSYTTQDEKPELILTITDPEGRTLGEDSSYKLNGYKFETVTTNVNESNSQVVKGYDVTEAHGLISIAYDKEIDVTVENEPSGEKSEEWSVVLTFINLDSDQQVNTGKHFNGELLIQKEEMDVTIADEAIPNEPLTQAVINLWNNTSYEESKIIKHDGSDANDANDQSYRYTGGDYALTDFALEKGYQSINDIIKLTCGDVEAATSNDYCATDAKYTLDYSPNIDNLTTLKQALTKAIDDGYISDNNIKNFVCFGENCTSNKENLYRIIGAFKVGEEYQIKLVKADEAGKDLLGEDGDFASQGTRTAYNTYLGNHNDFPRYYWNNSSQTNTWSESELNTQNLNTFYLEKLGDWGNMIASTEWQVGGMTYQTGHEQGAHTAYENELKAKTSPSHRDKIGLMYVSDYYYGATKDRWNLPGYVADGNDYRKAVWDNWIWIGDDFWFITPRTEITTYAFDTYTYGDVGTHPTTRAGNAARPSFYLNSNVKYVRGTGTSEDPIIID